MGNSKHKYSQKHKNGIKSMSKKAPYCNTFRIYITLYHTYQLIYCNGKFKSQVITGT